MRENECAVVWREKGKKKKKKKKIMKQIANVIRILFLYRSGEFSRLQTSRLKELFPLRYTASNSSMLSAVTWSNVRSKTECFS